MNFPPDTARSDVLTFSVRFHAGIETICAHIICSYALGLCAPPLFIHSGLITMAGLNNFPLSDAEIYGTSEKFLFDLIAQLFIWLAYPVNSILSINVI